MLRINIRRKKVTVRFIWTFKSSIYKKIAANDSKSYVGYLNKLVDGYNNTYHCSICKKNINADYRALPEEIETNPKGVKFKICVRVRFTNYKNVFSNGYTKNYSK